MDKKEYLFGQYLIRFSKKSIDYDTLKKALLIQESEDKNGSKHRKIGSILFQDFNVFEDLDDLLEHLELFEQFKKEYIE